MHESARDTESMHASKRGFLGQRFGRAASSRQLASITGSDTPGARLHPGHARESRQADSTGRGTIVEPTGVPLRLSNPGKLHDRSVVRGIAAVPPEPQAPHVAPVVQAQQAPETAGPGSLQGRSQTRAAGRGPARLPWEDTTVPMAKGAPPGDRDWGLHDALAQAFSQACSQALS